MLLTHRTASQSGRCTSSATSLWLPTLIIALIYVPYVYRPVRGQVLSVRREGVRRGRGRPGRLQPAADVLRDPAQRDLGVIVLLPLMVATTILTEAALSFLGVGVQPPNASWGTIISDGSSCSTRGPWVAIAPGIMIVLTVLALNVLGDGVRDALDPRAKLRVEGVGRGHVHHPPPALDRARDVRDHVLVFLIFFETPGVDPARQIAGRNPSARR